MKFTYQQQLVTLALSIYHNGMCDQECTCTLAKQVYDNTTEEQLKFIINRMRYFIPKEDN